MKNSKVWIVTGAASGFGLEIMRAVLASGDIVVAAVRSRPEALKTQLNHPNLHVAVLDVTNEAQAGEAAADTVKKLGRIDVLVLRLCGWLLHPSRRVITGTDYDDVERTG